MKQLKLNNKLYNACAPRLIAEDKYTCDAWIKGRAVRNHETLDALGKMLIKGKGYDQGRGHKPA